VKLFQFAAVSLLGLAGVAPVIAEPPGLLPLPARAQADPALVELGRHLFFEPRLSGDGSRSCASCHIPAQGFADGEALSRGYNGTEYFRNTPGLLSVRLKSRLMWDGRLDGNDLPTAVRDMVTEAHFMNADVRLVQERVRQIPQMMELWRRAFGEESEPYGPRIFAAVAEFLKKLDAGETAIDRALRGENVVLSPLVREGMRLFHGKARCAVCHHGPLGSDGRAHRLGVPENPRIAREPQRTITLLRHHATMGVPNYMAERDDIGIFAVSKRAEDRGRFVTPSLRGLRHTGPYMHNGVFATLEELVRFYDRGGGQGSELRPLGLKPRERHALAAFLRALSAPLASMDEPPVLDYGLVPGGAR
jgi:cytochrome c peroxidase